MGTRAGHAPPASAGAGRGRRLRRSAVALLVVALTPAVAPARAATATVVHVSHPLYWVRGAGTTSTGTAVDGRISQRVDGGRMDVVATRSGAVMTVVTEGLEPGRAYTIWFTFFNHPEKCVHPPAPGLRCGFLDLLNRRDTDGSLVYGDGLVATGSRDRFKGRRPVGEAPAGDPAEMIAFGTGVLTDPLGAEYQVTIRGHGPYDPETYGDEQIRTLNGGCHFGEKYHCTDEQAAGFRAQFPLSLVQWVPEPPPG